MYSSDSIHYFSSFSSKPYFHTSSSNHPEPTFVFQSIIPSLFNNIISHRTHPFTHTSLRPVFSARLKCPFNSTKSYSSSTYAHYRWDVLDMARIDVCAKPPPEDILTRINAVVQRKTAKGKMMWLLLHHNYAINFCREQLCLRFHS